MPVNYPNVAFPFHPVTWLI